MINDSFQFSCKNFKFKKKIIELIFIYSTADDESDVSPHDMEGGGIDLEYGSPNGNSSGLSLGSHFSIGQHSFSQMQVCCLDNFRFFGKFIFLFIFFYRVILIDKDCWVIDHVLVFMKVLLRMG